MADLKPQAPASIDIRVETVAQIFNSLDPSPFNNRDLDENAEHFVIDWAREIPRDTPIAINVCLPAREAGSDEARRTPEAIRNYFAQRADVSRRQMRENFRTGRNYLVMGLAILALCLSASAALSAMIPEGTIAHILSEGLVIVGWVANWKPLEIFLYDWQPIMRRLALYKRLAAAEVRVVAGEGLAKAAEGA